MARRPVVLCILDGVGLGAGGEDDAVATARTPTLHRLAKTVPSLALAAHGRAVGLPSDDDMGNSEVGHNAMGAGRVFDQGSKLVGASLRSGAAWTSEAWAALCSGRTLHFLGLLSDGNVHSHIDHLLMLLDHAAADGVRRIRVHVLTDGRDVGGRTALTYLATLESKLAELERFGVDAKIASGGGRMVTTMDRYDADWRIVERGWKAHVLGQGLAVRSAREAVSAAYADPDMDDQNLPPFVVVDEHGPVGTIEDGDRVLLFNFRGDRALQITRAFEEATFDVFDRQRVPDVVFVGMMQYDGDLHLPKRFLVAPPRIEGTVGSELVAARLRTFAVSETQKFGHVTYFFNGNRSGVLDVDLETYVEVPSDRRPFDEAPWMQAAPITDAVLEALQTGRYDHLRLNYPNGDMVGHTGNLEATRIAMECVDLQLARLIEGCRKAGAILLVTADHGNADAMWQRDRRGDVLRSANGEPLPRTSHTLAAVPLYLVDPEAMWDLRKDVKDPGIASIGGTLLHLLGLPIPEGWAPTLTEKRGVQKT